MTKEISVESQPTPTFRSQSQTQPVKYLFFTFAGLFVLLVGAAGGYWYGKLKYQKYSLKQPQTQNSTPVPPVVTPTPIFDPTANWKTYTHKLYKYVIKYPPSLYLDEVRSPNGLVELVRFVKEIERGGESLGVSVMVYDNPSNLTAKEWWEENAMSIFSYRLPIKESISEKRVINEYDAYFIKSTEEWVAVPFSYLFIKKDNKIYEISTNFPKENTEDYMFYNQILSTFRFLD